MCFLTRTIRDEAELIRFVRSPEGMAVPDLARKLPGRGVWLTLGRSSLDEAVRRRLFSKAFGAETTIPPDLGAIVSRLLRQQALSALSLARKAGEAVSGFMKVEEMVGRGRAAVLLHAVEAQPDGSRKLDKLAQPGVERMVLFHSHELDLAFGRSNVIHAAVAKGGLAEKLRLAARRIEMFEAQGGPEGPEEKR